MSKETIIYCYRMTHDYGTNPCVFTEGYEPTPDLLTEGGCMIQLRRNLKKHWAEKINSGDVDAYIMAVAGRSNDRGRWRDEQGKTFITPKYNHLIFVAKITMVDSIKNYLKSDSSNNRRDTYDYYIIPHEQEEGAKKTCTGSANNTVTTQSCINYCIEEPSNKRLEEPIIISKKFKYFGKSPLVLPETILDFFPMGKRARLAGKPFGLWNPQNGFYHSKDRPEDVKELLAFIRETLGEKNEIIDLPQYPFYINR